MRIAIIGRTETLYNTALLLQQDYEIGLIVTSKEAPEYGKIAAEFEALAEKWDIPYLKSPSNEKLYDTISNLSLFDVGVSMNYTRILPQKTIDLFRVGILNAHGGDLPRYRGNACQAWAILNGENTIGLCIHQMIGGEIDNGDIVVRDYLPISIETRIGEVYEWMSQTVPNMYLEAIGKLRSEPDYILERQSTNPADTLRCYPRKPEDGKIDWESSAEDIVRLVNASSEPYSGAFTELEGQKCIIWRASVYRDDKPWCGIPGQISSIRSESGAVVVLTGSGKVCISEIEIGDMRGKPAQKIKSTRQRFHS